MPKDSAHLGEQKKTPMGCTCHPPESCTKQSLAAHLNKLIDLRKLSQMEAAALIGMTQPKVSQIRRYQLKNISLERLIQALVALDQHVEIVIRPVDESQIAKASVAA
ncbi:MAG TPA: helix-turn-helix transcriptional regulator [Acidobacteriaceae bacterium]|jgi:predicted XRE-type DNA-binding protein|nr:helix-turn-helix transcriptional regulator [Acidobacteriaceae bacterium]